MNDTIILIGLIVAIILGVLAVVEARGRDWSGWACIVGFGVLLLARVA